jgi:hypothetical protein
MRKYKQGSFLTGDSFDKYIDSWVKLHNVEEYLDIAVKLANAATFVSFENFTKELDKCINACFRRIRSYALILHESTGTPQNDIGIERNDLPVAKSSSWLADAFTTKKQYCANNYFIMTDTGVSLLDASMNPVMTCSSHNFVLLDDASYSGTQLAESVASVVYHLFNTFAKYAISKQSIAIHVIVPYISEQAMMKIQDEVPENTTLAFINVNDKRSMGSASASRSPISGSMQVSVTVYYSQIMKSTFSYITRAERRQIWEGTCMHVFEHKVPDNYSLPVHILDFLSLEPDGQTTRKGLARFVAPYKHLAVEYLGKAKSRGKHLVTGYASAGDGVNK